ncbi:hypothetical protein [Noviherbaspirillum malthae]|jgi:hypothetical protein|uniref:hypothetical protein n=1 Tax=Noviherbaspirillum malthae TaxID=1260987 RepID=UPI0018902165|nr:hypothetical protein [Noviherbaspirillum malthae]
MVILQVKVFKTVQTKKPPSLAVFLGFGLALLFVRLPLLHRLWAGIAKVKVKVEARESHLLGLLWDWLRAMVQQFKGFGKRYGINHFSRMHGVKLAMFIRHSIRTGADRHTGLILHPSVLSSST